MKISKLQTLNFQGIPGQREFMFPDKIYALCQKNGTGKTSLLNAVRYGVTGVKQGNMITVGESTVAVGITVDDGDNFIRQEFTDKNPKYYFNKRPVSKKVLDENMGVYSGTPGNVSKIVTSSEVLENLKPQEFGDMILSYIPEQLTTEKVISYIDDASDDAKTFVKMNLPDDYFGTDKLKSLYDTAFESRKTVKKKLAELSGMMSALGTVEKTELSSEEYHKKRNSLAMSQRTLIEKINKKAVYQKAKSLYDSQLSVISELEKKIKDMNLPETVPNTEELETSIKECRTSIQNALVIMGTLDQNIEVFKKSLKTLDSPVCPLSDKLKCTTDKSVVRNDIEAALKGTEKTKAVQEEKKLSEEKKLEELCLKLKSLDNIKLRFREKEQYERQIKNIKSNLPTLPEDPGEVENAESLINEMNELLLLQKKAESFEKFTEMRKENESLNKQLSDLEYLVAAFSPKGKVKESITSYYLSTFEEQCNEKAESLKKGFRIKFVSDGGICVMADVTGNGVYRPISGLSGGERIYCLFIIIDMLCNLTGLRMMIFDELSVLDDESFPALIRLIKENEDDYDFVLLSTAEHTDIMDSLKKENINIVEV